MPVAEALKVAPAATVVVPVALIEIVPPLAAPTPSAISRAVAAMLMSLPVISIEPDCVCDEPTESNPEIETSPPASIEIEELSTAVDADRSFVVLDDLEKLAVVEAAKSALTAFDEFSDAFGADRLAVCRAACMWPVLVAET